MDFGLKRRTAARLFQYEYLPVLVQAYRRHLRSHQYDLVHVEGAYPFGFVAALAGGRAPYLANVQGADVIDLPEHDYGYRRFRPNSLAPDRATWAYDHRGAMLRVLGGPGDPATRIENRAGEPAANPYLFILSQVVAGLAGIEAELQPPAADLEPYAAARTMLPKSLAEALGALDKEPLFRRELGDTFIDYFVKLKRTEAGRYQRAREEAGASSDDSEPTAWEQNEYFDFF